MRLCIIHKRDCCDKVAEPILASLLSDKAVRNIVLGGAVQRSPIMESSTVCFAIPRICGVDGDSLSANVQAYGDEIQLPCSAKDGTAAQWHTISDGRFTTRIDPGLLRRVLLETNADIVAITADPSLRAPHERMRLAATGIVAGFRRIYEDTAELAPFPMQWPHHLLIRSTVLGQVCPEGHVPVSFQEFTRKCVEQSGVSLRAVCVGGSVTDLGTTAGLLQFCGTVVDCASPSIEQYIGSDLDQKNEPTCTNNGGVTTIGPVMRGSNSQIGENVIIAGPTVIGDDVVIGDNAVIDGCILFSRAEIAQDAFVQNRVILNSGTDTSVAAHTPEAPTRHNVRRSLLLANTPQQEPRRFRTWPRWSYARYCKRAIDVVIATIVLILFAPIGVFIAAAIKLTSPGPIFFKHRREGLHGRQFDCIKFRSMHVGSDDIQEKLRRVSQVDGPQFKIDDDPRISTVGRFLRETYIDEIPQFINVLFGQMSVIGPRPSPRKENTQCPYWRDARLSVRPGITGLWQICRTRKLMQDFQEWIYYDIEYVRNLSLKMDAWIFWKTFMKLVDDFIKQF